MPNPASAHASPPGEIDAAFATLRQRRAGAMLLSLCRADVLRTWVYARAQYNALVTERDRLRDERDAARQAFRELLALVSTRYQARAELTAFRREREIIRAQNAERDFAVPLH